MAKIKYYLRCENEVNDKLSTDILQDFTTHTYIIKRNEKYDFSYVKYINQLLFKLDFQKCGPMYSHGLCTIYTNGQTLKINLK